MIPPYNMSPAFAVLLRFNRIVYDRTNLNIDNALNPTRPIIPTRKKKEKEIQHQIHGL